jgi:malonate-semialdehyde dehydrogenase (acetylating)/methylmalonate-semialdehyde dehydrogenase
MAISVVILVGDSKQWIPDIVAKAKNLKLGYGFEENVDVAALCYSDVKFCYLCAFF